jgi:Chaperone of endosialidase/Head domain of trimeric autotransporter adhesin
MLLVLIIENFITPLQTICMKKLALLLSLIVIFISVHAQAPVNDEPCGAIDVPVLPGEPLLVACVPTTVYSYANATLTAGIPNPTCVGITSGIKDVWYKFTVPTDGNYVISTGLASSYNDIVMNAYFATACNGTFINKGCDDNTASIFPYLLISALSGDIIYIRIFMLDETAAANFKMCVSDYSINNNPVVDNTTKVGIGTTNPLAKLDVAGTGLFRDQVTFVKEIDLRSGLKIANNAGVNKVLTSDATGIASWVTPAVQANYWSISGSDIFRNTGGKVGIGTFAPAALLHVADSSVVFTGSSSINYSTTSLPPLHGYGGTRMMWYSQKAAFRVGGLSYQNSNWDRDSIGFYSFSTGVDTKAKGDYSTAFGSSTSATAQHSTAMGLETLASGNASTAMGVLTIASANSSTAMGRNVISKSENGLALGSFNDILDNPNTTVAAQTDRIFQIGNGSANNARSNAVTVLRNGNTGIGINNPTYKLHLGNHINCLRIEGPATAASGGSALNIGGFGDIVIDKPGIIAGRLLINEVGDIGIGSATPSAYGHGGTNRILELRNFAPAGTNIQSHLILSSTANAGAMGGVTWASTSVSGEQRTGYIGTAFETTNQTRLSFYTRSNTGILAERFYIQGSGNAWLQGTLTQNSDIRLKKNIVPLTFSLNKLTQLNGYTYNWISIDKDPKQQIGLIAQEVQKLYPQLVSEIKKENGETSLAVNYIGLIPVMIESIKEQQKQINELKLLVQKILNK